MIAPSKESSARSSAVASPTSKLTLSTPAAAASARAFSTIAGVRSRPSTEPTRGAIARAISPGPQATSSPARRRVLGDQLDHRVERLGEAHRRAAREGVGLVGELVADRRAVGVGGLAHRPIVGERPPFGRLAWMRVRPVSPAEDVEELGRGFKVVVDEERWLAIQPPVTRRRAGRADPRALRGRRRCSRSKTRRPGGPALVGLIDLHPTRIDGVCSLGMWILPGDRGKGGGRMLLEAAIDGRARPTSTRSNSRSGPTTRPAIALYERARLRARGPAPRPLPPPRRPPALLP